MVLDFSQLDRPVLVTGAAGFIGAAVSAALLEAGARVVGIDNLNDYYDPTLKQARLARLTGRNGFTFERCDLADLAAMTELFSRHRPGLVVNLAAQAGVRYSLENPHPYVQSNVVGFVNLLECCRHGGVAHLVYASTSSVYGANPKQPFSVDDNVDHPVSLYAATKKSNELLAHTYAHLHGLPVTGLRFFTVYGPWGRPDMAYWLFTRAILAGEPITLSNGGEIWRDFTYVDDVVGGVLAALQRPPAADPDWAANGAATYSSSAPYRLYNIGRGEPQPLMEMVNTLEALIGRTVEKRSAPLPPGDVLRTWADTTHLERDTGYKPSTTLAQGLAHFVDWYRSYFRV